MALMLIKNTMLHIVLSMRWSRFPFRRDKSHSALWTHAGHILLNLGMHRTGIHFFIGYNGNGDHFRFDEPLIYFARATISKTRTVQKRIKLTQLETYVLEIPKPLIIFPDGW